MDSSELSVIVKPTREGLEKFEGALLSRPQEEYVTTHSFAPGVYLRTIYMKAGSLLIGHEHRFEHFNVVLTGRASVIMDGKVHQIVAPCIFKSGAGVRKVLYIHENMEWSTVHPTQETNIEKLEDELVIKSPTFLNHLALQDQEKIRLLEIVNAKDTSI